MFRSLEREAMSRYQPSTTTAHGRGGGGGTKNKGTSKATSTKPISSAAPPSVSRNPHPHPPLLHPRDLSPSGSSAENGFEDDEDEEEADRTRIEGGGGRGKGGFGVATSEEEEEAEEDLEEDDTEVDGEEDSEGGGWNADEVTLVLPPSNDGEDMEESEGESEDEDEERTTAEINEMFLELGAKEYARLRKDLQEGVQPIYNSLQTLHSQANKHAKTLGTHKHGEINALKDLFDSLGSQGREAYSFTQDYEEQKETLLARWEQAHARKEQRKLKFLEDVAELMNTNRTKHEELLTEAGDTYASFTNKANHIGSEKEYNREVNRTMKRGLPGGR
ncbi:hypothetical protein BDY24DRAFT_384622 [Mrakia frigida]|uniref:uncharacterized protein n=1 Tax=Mrakia frigida TaxID=29902 RepID=UPI003FCC02F0